jgi:hypothetical protein
MRMCKGITAVIRYVSHDTNRPLNDSRVASPRFGIIKSDPSTSGILLQCDGQRANSARRNLHFR